MRSKERPGKEAAILIFSSIGSYTMLAVFNLIFSTIRLRLIDLIDVIGYVVLGVLTYIGLSVGLKRIYITNDRKLKFQDNRLSLGFYYLAGPTIFIISIIALFISFRQN
jgi:hypothetical protein